MTQPRWDARQLGSQTGRTYLVTGANSGIGLETARELVRRGAHVVLAVRDLARGEQARGELTAESRQGRASVLELDLADLDSVEVAAKRVADEHPALRGLVANAGVMGGPLALTAQGHERQMGTNHLGHAALISALWPLLRMSGGRVVVVSSIAARGGALTADTTRDQLVAPVPYRPQAVYANSKQANLLFAQELHRRAAASGAPVSVVAAHPGVTATALFTRQLRERGLTPMVPVADAVMRLALTPARAGALPTLRALDLSTPSGAFVGPSALGQTRGRVLAARVDRQQLGPAAGLAERGRADERPGWRAEVQRPQGGQIPPTARTSSTSCGCGCAEPQPSCSTGHQYAVRPPTRAVRTGAPHERQVSRL